MVYSVLRNYVTASEATPYRKLKLRILGTSVPLTFAQQQPRVPADKKS